MVSVCVKFYFHLEKSICIGYLNKSICIGYLKWCRMFTFRKKTATFGQDLHLIEVLKQKVLSDCLFLKDIFQKVPQSPHFGWYRSTKVVWCLILFRHPFRLIGSNVLENGHLVFFLEVICWFYWESKIQCTLFWRYSTFANYNISVICVFQLFVSQYLCDSVIPGFYVILWIILKNHH